MRNFQLIRRGLGLLAVIAILAMLCTVLLQIVGRHFLTTAPSWTEELGRFLLIWLTAIGASLALQSDGYRGAVEVITDRFPVAVKAMMNLLFMLLISVFLGVLLYYSYVAVLRNTKVVTSALGLPVAYFYSGIVLMAAGLLWALLHVAIAEISRLLGLHTAKDLEPGEN